MCIGIINKYINMLNKLLTTMTYMCHQTLWHHVSFVDTEQTNVRRHVINFKAHWNKLYDYATPSNL